MKEHRAWLLQAWQLALSRQGLTQPNPAVGAVLVKQGECVAKGRHFAAGQPHAEVMALQSIADASGMVIPSFACCDYWASCQSKICAVSKVT